MCHLDRFARRQHSGGRAFAGGVTLEDLTACPAQEGRGVEIILARGDDQRPRGPICQLDAIVEADHQDRIAQPIQDGATVIMRREQFDGFLPDYGVSSPEDRTVAAT